MRAEGQEEDNLLASAGVATREALRLLMLTDFVVSRSGSQKSMG